MRALFKASIVGMSMICLFLVLYEDSLCTVKDLTMTLSKQSFMVFD
ncbi:hypothetical protein HMPREF0530_2681 [Lacticaseibacillus paracasei subsp. paracasei ATCC 25302 = DSM 5622 = JCM 8130]|nr:hypothetical protein HMPREF0530_2681 [Lacticaseibacillus paracasei subsp. paracasei ATCC 25302 = DSM 5622 = JCM 8130]EKQ19976.1 hypothetical protein LCAUCD174_1184 [Lacticaseibacillus paracasei]